MHPDVADFMTPAETYASGYYLLYVNRCASGVTITRGFNDSRDNSSSIVPSTQNFPAYPYGDSSWNQVMSNVRDILSPFGVEVTDQDPGEIPHTELIACGRSFQGPGVLGAASRADRYRPKLSTAKSIFESLASRSRASMMKKVL